MLAQSDHSFAETLGNNVGQALVAAGLLAGVGKCWVISHRPTTNTKCALALMFVLASFSLASCGTIFIQWRAANVAFRAGMAVALLAGMVLAIIGLVEYSHRRGVYNQGRAEAIWALSLVGGMVALFTWGLTRGILSSPTFTSLGNHAPAGKVVTFDEYNFRFRTPGGPWLMYDGSKFNKASKVSLMRHSPEAGFSIVPEKLGNASLTTEQLAEAGKTALNAAANSFQVVSEQPFDLKGLHGRLVEIEAELAGHQFHYRNWYCVTNGYAYQLVGFTTSESQKGEIDELARMVDGFELIDPNRIATKLQAGRTIFTPTGITIWSRSRIRLGVFSAHCKHHFRTLNSAPREVTVVSSSCRSVWMGQTRVWKHWRLLFCQ